MEKTPNGVFRHCQGRFNALRKALTKDVDKFVKECDPEKGNMCLYGYPDGTWEVKVLYDEDHTELPEPTIGINFAKDSMPLKDWIYMVAVHSDAWLQSLAYYLCATCKFSLIERQEFQKMFGGLGHLSELVKRD